MRRIVVVAACLLACVFGLVPRALAGASDDPSADTIPSTSFTGACQQAVTSGCDSAALVDFDAVRAAEGLGPMTLPTDFDSLSMPLQLLTISNLERIDRGLAPVSGLSDSLDSLAQQGASKDQDPAFPSPFPGTYGGANWAGAGASTLLDDFYWMYDDGPDSSNGDCTSAGQSGCWGHRHDVIHGYDTPLLMGAAVDPATPDGVSMATEFIGGDKKDSADAKLLWSSIAADLPIGVSTTALSVATGSAAPLTLWASGEQMNVTASVTSGWSLDQSGCTLAAGTQCTVTVHDNGSADGVLTLTGPNGSQTVPLHSIAPPGAPTNVTATVGNASTTVSWAAPGDQGSSPITSYVVTATPGGAACTTTTTSCSVTGLANGAAYALTVRAFNAAGASEPSTVLSVTPTAPTASPVVKPGPTAPQPGPSATSRPLAAGCLLTHVSMGRRLQKVTVTCHGLGGSKARLVLQESVRGTWVTVRTTSLRLAQKATVVTTHLVLTRGLRVRDVLQLSSRRQLAVAGGRVS